MSQVQIPNSDHCIWRAQINHLCKSGLDPIDCKSITTWWHRDIWNSIKLLLYTKKLYWTDAIWLSTSNVSLYPHNKKSISYCLISFLHNLLQRKLFLLIPEVCTLECFYGCSWTFLRHLFFSVYHCSACSTVEQLSNWSQCLTKPF